MAHSDETRPGKAFFYWVSGFGDTEEESGGLFRATTAAKARYRSFLNIRDAGFDYTFADIRVRRAPEYDGSLFQNGTMRQFVEPREPNLTEQE